MSNARKSQTKNSHGKNAGERKRRRRTLPVLGAAGLSLSLAGGTSAPASGLGTDMSSPPAVVSQNVNLAEEEVSDVTLTTFYVFDRENPSSTRPGVRFAMGACGGGGCGGGCGGCGCWTGTDYTSSVFGGNPLPPPAPPKHKRSKPQSSVPGKTASAPKS